MRSRTDLVTAYTESINLLNYSVVVSPVTKANKRIDIFDNDFKPLGRSDEKNWRACKLVNPKENGNTMLIMLQMTQRSMMVHQ